MDYDCDDDGINGEYERQRLMDDDFQVDFQGDISRDCLGGIPSEFTTDEYDEDCL